MKEHNLQIEAMSDILQDHSNNHELVKSVDEYGRTPLHLAARRGDVKLGQELLDHGADINAQDSDFHPHSILDIALANNQYSFTRLLLDNGVDESLVLKVYHSRLEEMKATIEEERRMNLDTEVRKINKRGNVIRTIAKGRKDFTALNVDGIHV